MTRLSIAELEIAAIIYASTLFPGDLVMDWDPSLDERVRALVPKALARRHMHLEWMGDGRWQVCSSVTAPLPDDEDIERDYTRIACKCGRAWFSCGCRAEIDIAQLDAEDEAEASP